MLANLLAVGDALGLAPRVLTGFVDAEVNRLPRPGSRRARRRWSWSCSDPREPAAAPPGRAAGASRTTMMPLSSAEVDYPLLREMHAASGLASADAVHRLAAGERAATARRRRGPLVRVARAARARAGRSERRSSGAARPAGSRTSRSRLRSWRPRCGRRRAAVRRPTCRAASSISTSSSTRWTAWRRAPTRIGRRRTRSSCSRPGAFRNRSAYLCAGAGARRRRGGDHLLPGALDASLTAFGDRGYRLANLEAGLAGGRAYLAAYAQGFGASGLTFYDADVVRFFSPHAAGQGRDLRDRARPRRRTRATAVLRSNRI